MPPAPETLAAIIDRIDVPSLTSKMIEAFRSTIPGYQRLPVALLESQIAEVSRRNIELFFRSILEGGGPREAELEPFRASAKDRAAEGMPLEDLLAAYRLGGRVGWRAMGEAARPDERDALLLGAELTMDYVDRVSAIVAQTYLEERQALVSEEERRLRELLDAVLAGAPLTGGLREMAERLGFQSAERLRAFAQRLPGSPAREHAAAAAALRQAGMLALTEGDRVAGLAPAGAEARDFPVGTGLLALSAPTQTAGLAEAMDEARLLVDLGAREGSTGVIDPADHVAELLLARSPRVGRTLHRRVLGALEAYADRRGSDLLGTLQTFVACGLDRRRSAQALHIHPNTLDYRLRRAQELTELDLAQPADLALVVLALRHREMAAAGLLPPVERRAGGAGAAGPPRS